VATTLWQQRIQRAEKLAAQHPYAAEILGFYVHVARFQESLYLPKPELPAAFPQFLDLVARHGPERVAQTAVTLRQAAEQTWIDLLNKVWSAADPPSVPEEFLAFAYLQPFAEFSRDHARLHIDGYTGSICPWCNRKPAAGILRQQGDGGRRSLLCGFCLTEWEFRRVVCPGCGQEDHAKLPVYTAAELPYIRVECCDTCETYIKSIDLTKNGLANPLVDELASVPLNLWAQEHGYAKLHPNLLGM
jgi:FdhE protein